MLLNTVEMLYLSIYSQASHLIFFRVKGAKGSMDPMDETTGFSLFTKTVNRQAPPLTIIQEQNSLVTLR